MQNNLSSRLYSAAEDEEPVGSPISLESVINRIQWKLDLSTDIRMETVSGGCEGGGLYLMQHQKLSPSDGSVSVPILNVG